MWGTVKYTISNPSVFMTSAHVPPIELLYVSLSFHISFPSVSGKSYCPTSFLAHLECIPETFSIYKQVCLISSGSLYEVSHLLVLSKYHLISDPVLHDHPDATNQLLHGQLQHLSWCAIVALLRLASQCFPLSQTSN